MGGIKPIKSLRGRRQASQLPKMPRTYIRTTTDKVVRDRRRPTIQFGVDELEQRDVQKEGALGTATLHERIIYKTCSATDTALAVAVIKRVILFFFKYLISRLS